MLRDATDQRECIQRRGDHQLLAGRESQPGADGDFGEAVEILFKRRSLRELAFGLRCCS